MEVTPDWRVSASRANHSQSKLDNKFLFYGQFQMEFISTEI